MQQDLRSQQQIEVDPNGVAFVSGTNTKVLEIVLDAQTLDRSAQEIHQQHPHLSSTQIRAALEYYEQHKQELDTEIERRYQYTETLRQQATDQLTREELEERLKTRQRKSA